MLMDPDMTRMEQTSATGRRCSLGWRQRWRRLPGDVSMGIACKVAADRNITKVDIALPNIPNSPLETFWRENNVFLKGLEAAMRSTQLQLNMLRIYKAKGDWEAFVRHLKIDLEEEEERPRPRLHPSCSRSTTRLQEIHIYR